MVSTTRYLLHMRPLRSRIETILFICWDCRFKCLGQEEGEYFNVPVPPDGEEGNEELWQKFEVKSTSQHFFFYLNLSDSILIFIDIFKLSREPRLALALRIQMALQRMTSPNTIPMETKTA